MKVRPQVAQWIRSLFILRQNIFKYYLPPLFHDLIIIQYIIDAHKRWVVSTQPGGFLTRYHLLDSLQDFLQDSLQDSFQDSLQEFLQDSIKYFPLDCLQHSLQQSLQHSLKVFESCVYFCIKPQITNKLGRPYQQGCFLHLKSKIINFLIPLRLWNLFPNMKITLKKNIIWDFSGTAPYVDSERGWQIREVSQGEFFIHWLE